MKTATLTTIALLGVIAVFLTGQATKHKEFTLIENITATNQRNGKSIHLTKKRAFRSDGAFVEQNISSEAGSKGDQTVIVTRVSLPAERRFVVHDSVTNRKMTFSVNAKLSAGWQAPGSCSPPEYRLAGEGLVQGHKVRRYFREDQVGKWNISIAPDLDCAIVEQRIEWKDKDGNVSGMTKHEAVLIAEGAPDSHLFQVPNDAVESRPSEVFREQYRSLNGSQECPICVQNGGKNADLVYDKSRNVN